MKKSLLTISKLVLFGAFLNVFAFSVRHVVLGGTQLGVLTKPLLTFVEFPLLVRRAADELQQLPPYHLVADSAFEAINRLDRDLYGLNAHAGKDEFVFELTNLRTDSVLHSWQFADDDFTGEPEAFPVALPQNPILLADWSIVGLMGGTQNLFRLDKDSHILWKNESRKFHHSLTLSHDSCVWACVWQDALTYNKHSDNWTPFVDDVLTKIDLRTGAVRWERSLADILISNGYLGLVHGHANEEGRYLEDYFHLNDIQPILVDGPYWQRGDLLLSLRNRSMVILYRPRTNQVLRIITGPFLAQHDVDVVSDHAITIFNNNRTSTAAVAGHAIDSTLMPKAVLNSSNIVQYDLVDSSFSYPFLAVFEREQIYTYRQGTHSFLGQGELFVESTEAGIIYILRGDEVILKQYPNPITPNGITEYPHWMTIYESLDFLN